MNNLPGLVDNEILELCRQGKKIEAIKLHKNATGMGLKESKDYVDQLAAEHFIETPAGKGACFVATACYGDYNAPEVLMLRSYRDEKLLTTLRGKIFVKLYYRFSPAMARQLEKCEKLKHIVRTYILKPIVNKIERQHFGENG